MRKILYRILHNPLTMSVVGVLLAFSIVWSLANANIFRVDVPVYPGAQQSKTYADDKQSTLTFVTSDSKEQVLAFYKKAFSTGDWYYLSLDSSKEKLYLCCYLHVFERTYFRDNTLLSRIKANYHIDVSVTSEEARQSVTVAAHSYEGGFRFVDFDYDFSNP
jgi:hypothetical protein